MGEAVGVEVVVEAVGARVALLRRSNRNHLCLFERAEDFALVLQEVVAGAEYALAVGEHLREVVEGLSVEVEEHLMEAGEFSVGEVEHFPLEVEFSVGEVEHVPVEVDFSEW